MTTQQPSLTEAVHSIHDHACRNTSRVDDLDWEPFQWATPYERLSDMLHVAVRVVEVVL